MIAAYVSPWNRSISRRRRRFEAHHDSAPTMFDPILQYLGTIPAEVKRVMTGEDCTCASAFAIAVAGRRKDSRNRRTAWADKLAGSR